MEGAEIAMSDSGSGSHTGNGRQMLGMAALIVAFVAALATGINVGAVLLGLAIVAAVIGMMLRGRRGRAEIARPPSKLPVTACVAPLRQNPTLNQARAALPEYCCRLLQNSGQH